MLGLRILKRKRCVDQKWIEQFNALPVSVVSDSMSRLFSGGCSLRPFHKSGSMCGAAITVRTRPGDNLLLHKALDMAGPGDVVVVDGGGDTTNALIGELMIAHAKNRGIAGIVLYGAVRDSEAIAQDSFPIFAKGVTHRGPYKDGPGEINVTIAIEGLAIEPGDLIMGDADGILAIPYNHVQEIYESASAKHQAELAQMARIEARKNDRTWVDVVLREKGCQIEI